MNIEEAERLHVELLQNLPGPAGDAASALSEVIKLHAPVRDGRRAACRTCATWQEEREDWPCGEIAVINAYAHVDGIPAGAEQYSEEYERRHA